MTTTTERPAKVIGAMKHLLLQLEKNNVINEIDREHLLDRYIRGHIAGFGHLAEWLHAFHMVNHHNYVQIIMYGNHYGETNYLENDRGEKYLTDPNKPVI